MRDDVVWFEIPFGLPFLSCLVTLRAAGGVRFLRAAVVGEVQPGLAWGVNHAGGHVIGNIVTAAISRHPQALDHIVYGGVEVGRGCEYIRHVEQGIAVLPGVRLAQNASEDLLHVNPGGAVGCGSQDVGERAVPPLFQRVDRDDVSHRAFPAHQVDAFQFVETGGLYLDFLFWGSCLHQFGPDSGECYAVLVIPGLSLDKDDGADVVAAVHLFCLGFFFQVVPKGYGNVEDVGVVLIVAHHDGKLDHILSLQARGVNETDDVAPVAWGGGQVEHKARFDVGKRVGAQVALEVMAFVNDHDGVEMGDDPDERGLVGTFDTFLVGGVGLDKLGKVLILVIHQPLVCGFRGKRLDAQHENAQLLLYDSRVEILAEEEGLLVVHFHPSVEERVYSLSVRMLWIP